MCVVCVSPPLSLLPSQKKKGQVGGDVDNPADSESDIASDLGDKAAPVDPASRNLQITPTIRDALFSLDEIDLVPIFKRRPCLMGRVLLRPIST